MRKVGSKDTTPEMIVRKIAYKLGYRYRLHRKELPGNPDLAFIGRRKVIFVHGCFWHGHSMCKRARIPKTNRAYWSDKISKNTRRDEASLLALREMGWRAMVIWECELHDLRTLPMRIKEFLDG